jgi:hypothetical protein
MNPAFKMSANLRREPAHFTHSPKISVAKLKASPQQLSLGMQTEAQFR